MIKYITPPAIAKEPLEVSKSTPDAETVKYMTEYIKAIWPYQSEDMYNISKDKPKVYLTPGGIPVLRVIVQRTDDRVMFQENTIIQPSTTYRAFHGTRQLLISHILKTGLKSSIHSHGIIGTWANLDIDQALLWTSSMYDLIPSLALEVLAPWEDIRSNQRIKKKNPNRLVVKLRQGQSHPALYVNAILIAIPSRTRTKTHGRLLSAMRLSAAEISKNSGILQEHQIFNQLWNISSFRYAYANDKHAMSDDFGGLEKEAFRCILQPSIHFTRLIYAMTELSNDDNRRTTLQEVDFNCLTIPMQNFAMYYNKNIRAWTSKKSMTKEQKTSGMSNEMVTLKTWGPVHSHEEAVSLKMIEDEAQPDEEIPAA